MIIAKILHLIIHLIFGLLQTSCLFPWINNRQKSRLIKIWSNQLLRILQITITLEGPNETVEKFVSDTGTVVSFPEHTSKQQVTHFQSKGIFYVANHISWVDIFIINSVHPMVFLSKDDIERWPLFGLLCKQAGTLFIDRTKRRAILRAIQELKTVLNDGMDACFFPEGTTTNGTTILPILNNLFEAVAHQDFAVQPLLLYYHLANSSTQDFRAAYIDDMDILTSIKNIIQAKGIHVNIVVGEPIPTLTSNRREIGESVGTWLIKHLQRKQLGLPFHTDKDHSTPDPHSIETINRQP